MNREELHWLIFDNLFRSQHIGPESELQLAATDLMDALWPVLAQVWDEGYRTGHDETDPTWPSTANPYLEVQQ